MTTAAYHTPRGVANVWGPVIFPTLARTPEIVARYRAAIDEVFGELAWMLNFGDLSRHLKGPRAHTGFRRLL